MASSISALNSLLLNPYTQNALNAAQSKQAIDPIKPGATVTARYTVGEDGELQLRQFDVGSVKVIDPIGKGDERTTQEQQKKSSEEAPRRNYTFSDIAKPKAILLPSDEATLFSSIQSQPPLAIAKPSVEQNANSNITDIEVESPREKSAALNALASQKQQKVASLYARNLDIIYNIIPIYSQAA